MAKRGHRRWWWSLFWSRFEISCFDPQLPSRSGRQTRPRIFIVLAKWLYVRTEVNCGYAHRSALVTSCFVLHNPSYDQEFSFSYIGSIIFRLVQRAWGVEGRTFSGSNLQHGRFCFDQSPKSFSITTLSPNANPRFPIEPSLNLYFLKCTHIVLRISYPHCSEDILPI